uniref:(northern house mosquito) hypothetical protein n=1 Tax=Culex pipiens TaxID=7175 RepID=A0A8D8APF2_CULPI
MTLGTTTVAVVVRRTTTMPTRTPAVKSARVKSPPCTSPSPRGFPNATGCPTSSSKTRQSAFWGPRPSRQILMAHPADEGNGRNGRTTAAARTRAAGGTGTGRTNRPAGSTTTRNVKRGKIGPQSRNNHP